MRTYISIFISSFLLLISCEKNSNHPTSSSNEYSIVGKIIDQASGQGLEGSIVKIVNDQNAYQITSGTGGAFSFQNIKSGEYLLTTESSQNGKILTDTCGNYNTDTPDWGNIYSNTFASIRGTINLDGETDHSFINVQLLGTDKSAITNNRGKFRIDFIFPDTFDLYISKDKNYKEIRLNDLVMHQGDIFEIDTTMLYRFKPLVLEEQTGLDSLSDKDAGFCFASGYFWYTNIKGLLKYDPINTQEEQVFVLNNTGPYAGIYYLGIPYVTYDYGDGIWLSMDEPSELYYRKYSIINNSITDSIQVKTLPSHHPFRIAYDPINNYLVLFESYTAFYPKIHKYDLVSHNIETVNLQLEEYEFSNYKDIEISEIFIDPNGKVYFILKIKDLNDIIKYHLYICNNLSELNLIQIYKFPDTYNYSKRLSFYNNEVYTVYGGKVYKLVF